LIEEMPISTVRWALANCCCYSLIGFLECSHSHFYPASSHNNSVSLA
jgi:hypothetical protein